MNIQFKGVTNKDYVAINTSKFKLPSGAVLTIDRCETVYEISKDGTLEMTWKSCYLWAVDDYFIFENPDYSYVEFSDATSEEFSKIHFSEVQAELEDDADEDYFVKFTSVFINGREVYHEV